MIFTLYILICFVIIVAYAAVIVYAIEGWQSKPITQNSNNQAEHACQCTLIIAARNPKYIPPLPDNIPIIIVDDHSQKCIEIQQSNVEVLRSTYPQGKKYALKYGIEHASTPYIITTDIDTNPTNQWVDEVTSYIEQYNIDLLILPLNMSANGFFESLQQTEYVALQTLTGGFALQKQPIMCSGANLAFNRKCWLEAWEDIRPDIPSGDDMFLLHSFKKKGLAIDFIKSTHSMLEIQPAKSLAQLFRQRTRWAGKGSAYTDLTTLFVGILVILANLVVILCPPMLIIKWIADLALLFSSHIFFNYQHAILKSIALSFIYPLYILITLILIPFNKNKW